MLVRPNNVVYFGKNRIYDCFMLLIKSHLHWSQQFDYPMPPETTSEVNYFVDGSKFCAFRKLLSDSLSFSMIQRRMSEYFLVKKKR